MKKEEAVSIVKSTFGVGFNEEQFKRFVANLFKKYEPVDRVREGHYIKESFRSFIIKYKVIGVYTDTAGKTIDILEVALNKISSLAVARTAQRNFVADYLKTNGKDAALVVFITPKNDDWRLSLVRLDHTLTVVNEKLKAKEEITPAKRWSFLVGKNEGNHTVQSRFTSLLVDDEQPTLAELEMVFDIEKVTKEFFDKYTELYFRLKEHLDELVKSDKAIREDFEIKEISTVDFAKKTLGQIVFLYFLQKKGWFGVAHDKKWGEGPKRFIRELFERREKYGTNFFDDILEPLFYEALAQDRGADAIYPRLNNCRMPFLNGGLFEPMNGYRWETTNIILPDTLFSNSIKTKEGDVGDGILDVFDRYNFTVNENEPLEKEVAVDPEMLGKVFENLLEIKDRKSKGAFYTPREIVHYMCQESLINYLCTETNGEIKKEDIETFIRMGDRIIENDRTTLAKRREKEEKGFEYKGEYKLLLPTSIVEHADQLDTLLKDIKVADPAVGSGAFPLGMITEIVRARKVLGIYGNTVVSDYKLKLHAISHSIHGVDIDPGAVEIAKLRLWLALIVEENEPHPLPNLDHKIMQGNSLISEYEGIKLFDKAILHEGSGSSLPVQLGLGLNESESERTMKELQSSIDVYVHESSRSKKQALKEKIDNLKWELIETTLKEQNKLGKLEEIKKMRQKNVRPFFVWELEFSDVFMNKGGFDVVIGNPPYVGEKGNKEIFRPIKQGHLGRFYQGKMDLFYYFFHLALDIGRNSAQIAFITTNYYMTATGGIKLRKDIKERASIRTLVNFNELRIFESARGQHNIITILSKGHDAQITAFNCITKRTGDTDGEILNRIVLGEDTETTCFHVQQNNIFEGNDCYIRIGGNTESAFTPIELMLQKVSRGGDRLDDLCNVNQGIVTGADKISKKHIKTLGLEPGALNKGIFVISDERVGDLVLNEREKVLLKPWFKNSDIKKWWTKLESESRVIYSNSETIKDIESFPGIRDHLQKFKPIISAYAYRWHDLHRPRNAKIFSEPKILAPQRSPKNIFGYNTVPWFASADVYFITKKVGQIELKYILALLNSKLYYLWLYNKGKRKGDMLELYQKPLSEIPIKKISGDEQKPFVDLVDEILLITSSESYNPQKPPIRQKELESKIDEMVMDLYELTEEEKEIVRNS